MPFATLAKLDVVGALCALPTSDYNALLQADYPSLLAPKYILFGPLSLANHNCTSKLFLGAPEWALPSSVFAGFQVPS